ncbi:MAG TPA: sulfotransferase [Fusibacter sp.]|nr:sulfotransferase [Fusibacter sp.]
MDVDYCIILGCPRSGTSFLVDSLKALPYTECLSGISFPVPIIHLVAQALPNDTIACLDYALESSFDVYLDAYAGSRFRAVQRFLDGSLTIQEAKEIFLRQHQVQRLIYKEPFFSFAPEFVYRALPTCKIIYLIRDGRDCANSLVKSYGSLTDEKLKDFRTPTAPLGYLYQSRPVPWWVATDRAGDFLKASPYVRSIWMWKEMIKSCEAFFSQDHVVLSRRVLKIKYEDLTRDPRTAGEKIAQHLGVPLNKRLLSKLSRASIQSIGKHKSRDPLELEIAEDIAYTELNLQGYVC